MEKHIILREFQDEMVDETEGHFAFSDNEAVCLLPTGGGKSYVILKMTSNFLKAEPDGNVVVLVNITSLIYQLSDLFDEFGIAHNILKADVKKTPKKLSMKVTIAMQQTLARRTELKPECDMLIVDERHISFGSNTMLEIENRLEPKRIIGFSATPVDGKGARLEGVDIIETVGIRELTAMGYLTPVRTYVARFSEILDFSDVEVGVGGDYNENKLSDIINTPEYNREVVNQWKKIKEMR